ncbi:MAG TPA: hypothetical protein VK676_00730 [Steroidobacteraceae bacterium]|jgi:hypothetical protein|nr:hypothetical protein [Steroidobacteraceae bacterium]
MKYLTSVLAAAAAVGITSLAWGAGPEDQTVQSAQPQAAQSMPQQAEQPAPPPADTHLSALVPAGMSTDEACTGFKSVKDCAASLHASQNLNIPFVDLKAKVTGGQRLGAAIHALKPDVNARAEVKRAEGQAAGDVHGPRG